MAKKKNEKKPAVTNEAAAGATVDSIATEPTKQKKSRQKNSMSIPWMAMFFGTMLGIGAVCAWMETRFVPAAESRAISGFQHLYSQSLSQSVNASLAATRQQLLAVSQNTEVMAALNLQDPAQLAHLANTLSAGFRNLASLQLIPWDMTGTAGLKARNIEPRNNIELMMLSRAGSNKETLPEAYQDDGKWLLSFSVPVIQDGVVTGVLLASFNDGYLKEMISKPAFTDNARASIKLKDQAIISAGQGGAPASEQLPLEFTDGSLHIEFNETALNNLKTPFQPVYFALAGILGLLLVLILVGQRICLGFVRKDAQSIINYADSLSALHKTSHPDLHISQLLPLLETFDALSERTTKTAITNEVRDDYKSPQAVKLPEKVAMPVVAETNTFEHPEIFRDYDIRGIAETQLDPDTCVMLGKAIGSYALSLGNSNIVMGRDGRLSSEKIQYDVSRGILATGCNVINISQVPSPVLYYATLKLGTGAGVMITGSHNPAEYNGLKIVLDNKTLQGAEMQELLRRIESYDFSEGQGKITKQEITQDYINDVSTDIIVARSLNVVVDAGNGVGGDITTQVLARLDCQVTPLFCEVDGRFPNRGPDPSVRANLTDLVNKVQETGADFGIAFDGDADRMVAVTSSGRVVSGDQLLMLFAKDIVSRNAGSHVVYDVKCSRNVEKLVSSYGGRAIMTRSGHSNLKAKMQETEALLGAELTGHFYFKERWNGFDDGIYAAMRLLELLSTGSLSLDEELATLPDSPATPELHIRVSNREQADRIISKMQEALASQPCRLDQTDGLRAEFDHGWGLIRASNTSDSLSLRFEADSEESLASIQDIFKTALNSLNLNLSIPF